MVRGRSVSRVKYLISCCLPSSNTVKSGLSRLPTNPPTLLCTVQRTLTRLTLTLIGSCAIDIAAASDNARKDFILILYDAEGLRGGYGNLNAKSHCALEEGGPGPGRHYRTGRTLQDSIPRTEFSVVGAIDRLSTAPRKSRIDDLQSADGSGESRPIDSR